MHRVSVKFAIVLTTLVVLWCPADGAQPTKQVGSLGGADVPDSVICSTNAYDRTRPFLIGEKTVYFVNIRDGDRVKSPFRVAFAVSGMGVSPVKAGVLENTGHHHILIDQPIPVDIKAPIPFDKPDEYEHQHYKHFGGGETETVLNLPPGRHTLRLLFANNQHIPYYMGSKEITIEVIGQQQN
ncbi:MAG: DUF4399 domain-containing protein [Burkholderiaceae bacterium]|jgi:hypothetical protein